MKKCFIIVMLGIIAIASRAQFVLTPSNGLTTSDNAYSINITGSEVENYYTAKKAISKVLPEAVIGEVEYEKSFTASSKAKVKMKVKSAFKSLDFVADYTLKIETGDNMISISFNELKEFEYRKKSNNEPIGWVIPTIGRNDLWTNIANVFYVFNSKGDLKQPKCKQAIEDWANGLVNTIETMIQNEKAN